MSEQYAVWESRSRSLTKIGFALVEIDSARVQLHERRFLGHGFQDSARLVVHQRIERAGGGANVDALGGVGDLRQQVPARMADVQVLILDKFVCVPQQFRPEELGVIHGERRFVGGADQVRLHYVRVGGGYAGALVALAEERLRVAHEVLVERVVVRH